jgi:hypothetical protein
MKNQLSPLFMEVFKTSTKNGQTLARSLLERNGYQVEDGETFCYGKGTIPILIVAHTDIVHEREPSMICYDATKRVAWSPQGLGADDRAGVYGIASLLALGYRPHVLFTDEEETGGRGAEDAAFCLDVPAVHCMIQLDRMNAHDSVFYSCDSKSWRKWVNKHGFKTAQGSFTDISVLMPNWGIAGVNLSVGYYGQHTKAEYLRLEQLTRTLEKVEEMLRRPPKRAFPYVRELRKEFRFPAPSHDMLGSYSRTEDRFDYLWERAELLGREKVVDVVCDECANIVPSDALDVHGRCPDCTKVR